MVYSKVICVQASKRFPEAVNNTGLLTANAETGYGLFAPDSWESYFSFSTVKTIKTDGQTITVTTKNSTWIFEQYTN